MELSLVLANGCDDFGPLPEDAPYYYSPQGKSIVEREAYAARSRTVKVVPFPWELITEICPSCFLIIS